MELYMRPIFNMIRKQSTAIAKGIGKATEETLSVLYTKIFDEILLLIRQFEKQEEDTYDW